MLPVQAFYFVIILIIHCKKDNLCGRVNSNSPSKDCHSPNVSMLGEVEMVEQGGEEGTKGGYLGEICGMQVHSDPPPELLLLLLEVTQTNGRPLPVVMFTVRTAAQHVIKLTGQNPIEVDVMNDHEASCSNGTRNYHCSCIPSVAQC